MPRTGSLSKGQFSFAFGLVSHVQIWRMGQFLKLSAGWNFFLKHPCHSSQLTSEDETAQAILSILVLRIATNPNDMSRPISETENFGMNPKSVDPTGKF